MLCILRLSLTSKWFGFTFLWSPAGRCLRGALPIAGTRPPLPLYPSTSLPPILPGCHSTPICPSPALLTLSHTHNTHTHKRRGLAGTISRAPSLGCPPTAEGAARPPRCRAPGPHGAFGNRGRHLKPQLVPTQAGFPSPSDTDRAAVLNGTPGAPSAGDPGHSELEGRARQQFTRCRAKAGQGLSCKLTALLIKAQGGRALQQKQTNQKQILKTPNQPPPTQNKFKASKLPLSPRLLTVTMCCNVVQTLK